MRRSLQRVSCNLSACNHRQALQRKHVQRKGFHSSTKLFVIKPFVLADIGEGIREVQIIQWFVQPGARVEQFDKICEVASDKAVVEITSRFDGVIKKLHYEPDALAQVGKPLCDIDIEGGISPADEKLVTPDLSSSQDEGAEPKPAPRDVSESSNQTAKPLEPSSLAKSAARPTSTSNSSAHLATPAVRGLLKEHNLDISHIQGTGRDGRVLKEDIHAHLNSNATSSTQPSHKLSEQTTVSAPPTPSANPSQVETTISMSPMQAAMYKTMTRSLSIPHFLYSDEVDLTDLSTLRNSINTTLVSQPSSGIPSPSSPFSATPTPPINKLSYLPFIIKAVSLSLHRYPILNATISIKDSSSPTQPKLLHRPNHNIGIAIDTPTGLLVPVIKNVQNLSIHEIAHHLAYLQSLAANGKLTAHPDLLSGGTITISNIGNIGGGVLSPVLVEGQSAILGIGKAKDVPRFETGSGDKVVRRMVGTFSWTADHRVLDGATVARFAESVKGYIERPGGMVLGMR